MSREVHARFCESRGVRFPPATHPFCNSAGGVLAEPCGVPRSRCTSVPSACWSGAFSYRSTYRRIPLLVRVSTYRFQNELQRAQAGDWVPQELRRRQASLRGVRVGLSRQQARLLEAYLAGVVDLATFELKRNELQRREEEVPSRPACQWPAETTAATQHRSAGSIDADAAFCFGDGRTNGMLAGRKDTTRKLYRDAYEAFRRYALDIGVDPCVDGWDRLPPNVLGAFYRWGLDHRQVPWMKRCEMVDLEVARASSLPTGSRPVT